MFKRPIVILGCLTLAAVGVWLYVEFRVPFEIEPKGEGSETIAWFGLAGGVISFLTAIVGVVQKVVELRAAPNEK